MTRGSNTFPPIGDGADHHGHLQWGNGDLLANAHVGELTGIPLAFVGNFREVSGLLLSHADPGAFTEVELFGHAHHALELHDLSVLNEVTVAGFDERAAEVVHPGCGGVFDLAATDEGASATGPSRVGADG